MGKIVKPTLVNLEREENEIFQCFDDIHEISCPLREHVANIKTHKLYLAVDCKSFKDYCETGRIKVCGGKIVLEYSRLRKLAINGEIEKHMPKGCWQLFSEKSLNPLSKLRVEIKDDLTGAVNKETQNLDVKRIKAVVRVALNERAEGRQITAAAIKATIEKKYGHKPPKRLHELMKTEQRRATRFLASLQAVTELDGGEDLFSDAEEESPGCAKRLAAAYTKAEAFLHKRKPR